MEENPEGSVLLNKLKDALLTNEETKKILETSGGDLKESKDRCNEVLREVHMSAVRALDEAYVDAKNKVQQKHDDLKERLEGKQKILQRSNFALMTEIVQLAGSKCDESSARKCEDVLESCREALHMRNADHNVVFNFIPNKKLKPKLGVLQLCGNLPSDFKLRLLTPIHDIAIGKQVRCGIEGDLSKENLQHLEFCIKKESNIIASETTRVEDKLVTFSFRPDADGVHTVMARLFGINVVASPLSVVVPPNNVKEESSNSIPLAVTKEESKTENMSNDSRAGGNETKLKEVSQIVEQKIIENKETVADVSVSENEDATFIEETKDEGEDLLDSDNIEVGKVEEMSVLDSNNIEVAKVQEVTSSNSNYKRFDEAGDRIAEDTSWKVGDRCIARWEEDGVWYRAEVKKIQPNGVLVSFMDYGNEAIVYNLVNMFLEIPETDAYDDDVILPCDCLEMKTDDDKALVDETTTKSSFSLGDVCLAKWSEDNVWYRAVVKSQLSSGSFTVIFTDYGNTATVQLKNLLKNVKDLPKDTPSFYVDKHVELVESSVDNRGSCPEDLDKLEKRAEFSLGQVCVARWAKDLVWYNAKIVGINKDRSYLVQFVDYGITESVDSQFIVEDGSKIPMGPTTVDKCYVDLNVDQKLRKPDIEVEHDSTKELPSSSLLTESEVSKISKTATKDDTCREVDGRDAMDKSMEESNVTVLSKYTDGMGYEVEKENARKSSKTRNKSTPAMPRPLKDMSEQSTNSNVIKTEKNPICDEIELLSAWQPGDSCLALWSEDLVWYNGVVERRNHNGSYTVTFTDYGNQEEVKPGSIVQDHLALVATGKLCTVDANVKVDKAHVVSDEDIEGLDKSQDIHGGLDANEKAGSIECQNPYVKTSIGSMDEDEVYNSDTSFGFDSNPVSPSSQIKESLLIQRRSMDETFVETLNLLTLVKVSDRGTPVLPVKEVLRIDNVEGPIGITVLKNKNIVISSSSDNSVKMFNPRGEMVGLLESRRRFKRPSDMSSLSTGDLVVRDDAGLQLFTEEGVFIKEVGQSQIDKCYGVTQDDEGLIVTINAVRASDHSMPGSKGKGGLTDVGETDVFYIDRESGSVIRKYELVDIIQPEDKTKTKCRFINSHEGKVYIVDLGLDCVYILDTNGNQAVSFGSSGTGPGEFQDPAGLVVDDAGNMIVADSRNHRLQVFDREGGYVAVVQVDKPFNRPSGVYLDKVCKELYVLNYWGNSLVKYRIG